VFDVGNKISRNILLSTDQGLMIVNRFDCNQEMVGHSQWLLDHGNCNTLEVNDCVQAIKNITNPVIFDIGSNIGTLSVWFSKIFKNGQIYCFEPQRQIFYQLCGNISLNNLYNVEAFNMAVGSTNGYITVKEPNYFTNHDFGTFSLVQNKITNTNKNLTVPVTTLDKFVKDYQINHIDLLKIDVEGMDLEVLKGAVNVLENFSPVIYIEHCDNNTSVLELLKDFLIPFDYSFDIRKNNLLCQK